MIHAKRKAISRGRKRIVQTPLTEFDQWVVPDPGDKRIEALADVVSLNGADLQASDKAAGDNEALTAEAMEAIHKWRRQQVAPALARALGEVFG